VSSQPPAPPAPRASELTRGYAEWFAWAGGQYRDERQARVATEAAVAALVGGADPGAAAAAAQQAVAAPDAATRPLTADMPTQAYGTWYAWAVRKAGVEPERAHLAAAAGRAAQAAGLPVPEAQRQALTAAGVPAPAALAPSRPGSSGLSWRDPALRAIVYGIVCLVLPFFHFYLIVLPFLGLAYAIRALTQSRLVYGIVGVGVNGVAAAITAAFFFGLLSTHGR
jgi:hypothetical protein